MTSAGTFAMDDDNISNGVADVEVADREEFLRNYDLAFFTSMTPTVVYVSLLMLVGLPGNSVVFLVYYKRFEPKVSRTYILTMGVVDLLTNTVSLLFEVLNIRYQTGYSDSWLCTLGRTTKSFLAFTSTILLVAVAVDRYRTVCRPNATRTRQNARIILMVCIFIATLYTIPFGVMSGAQTFTLPDSNVTVPKCSESDAYVSTPFLLAYNVMTGLMLLACVTLMLTAYVMIALHLWRHNRGTQFAVGSVGEIPTRTTKMMFVLTVIYVSTCLPYALVVALRSRFPVREVLGMNGYQILICLYLINSSVNSLVYSLCSAKFRQECRLLFSCRSKRGDVI